MTINSGFRLAALLGLACVTLLAGCAGTKTPTSYYSLYAPASQISGASPVQGDLSVSVGPVSIPDILKQTRIATGGENGSFRLSEFHRWSGDVDRDLGRTLAEHLSRELGTEEVFVFPWDQNFTPAYQVYVDVLHMSGNPGGEATLSVRWSLVDRRGKGAPIIRRSELREASGGSEYDGWVAAQQRNVAHLAQEIARELTRSGQ
jgi:uncharacterized lipoprotein YmbA